jgi:hypothetical protein
VEKKVLLSFPNSQNTHSKYFTELHDDDDDAAHFKKREKIKLFFSIFAIT